METVMQKVMKSFLKGFPDPDVIELAWRERRYSENFENICRYDTWATKMEGLGLPVKRGVFTFRRPTVNPNEGE